MSRKDSKRIRSLRESRDSSKEIPVTEAIALVKKNANAKFDETIEAAIRLGVDPRKSDQAVRGVVSMPSGTGRTAKVAVFCNEDRVDEAKGAGADITGMQDVTALLEKGDFSFDVLIAEPTVMAQLSKHGAKLGPKGLMPNPKVGTVTNDIATAVEKAKAGQVSYRTERAGIVHAPIGNSSFSDDDLVANFNALVDSVKKAKPSASKGQYLVGIKLSSTMGPSVTVDVAPMR